MSSTYPPRAYPPPPPSFQYPPAPRKHSPLRVLLLTCLTLSLLGLCALLALGGTFFALVASHNQPIPTVQIPTPVPTLPPLKVYNVVGKPTIDATFINNVLENYSSPASGKGQALYDYGIQYGINPAYALAFFLQESNFGTKGVATVTHALGNIRASTGMPQYQGYRLYNTWEDGFQDWYQLIAKKYVGEWHLSTVEQIIPVYAPAKDNNDEAQYILTVKSAIERWRNGYIDV
jgi:Mannosyl-glycoprotein endo-beta-N-acetylglucosaminidase